MEFLKKNLGKVIAAVVVLVIGILCIIAGAASGEASADAYKGISITLGVSLLVVAGIIVVFALIANVMTKGEAKFAEATIGISATLALGIFFIADEGLGGQLIWLFLNYVPYVLLVTGSILIVDAILTIVFGFVNKNVKVAVVSGIFTAIVGGVSVLLGALMVGNNPTISKDTQLIIFGIIITLFAALICLSLVLTFSTSKDSKNAKKDDSIDAEVKEVKEETKEENN